MKRTLAPSAGVTSLAVAPAPSRRRAVLNFALGMLAATSARELQAASVTLSVVSVTASAQADVPVFYGVPFPPGVLSTVAQIAVYSAGVPVPRQVSVSASYRDGSVRWALVGMKTTLAGNETRSYEIRYNEGAGVDLAPALSWSWNGNAVPLLPPSWYAASDAFGPILTSEESTISAPFEGRMRQVFPKEDVTPPTGDPTNRPYYDRAHALHLYVARTIPSDPNRRKAYLRAHEEIVWYRTNEVQQTGPYRGQYAGPAVGGSPGSPIDIARLRRMYVEGLVEDYFLTGDPQSMTVARWMADQLRTDAYVDSGCWRFHVTCAGGLQTGWYGRSTERNLAWPILELETFYEATLEQPYLDAAIRIADFAVGFQQWWAAQHPADPLKGGLVQDPWFDPSESDLAYGVSGFMSTLLADAWIKMYRITGDADYRDAAVTLARVLLAQGWDAGEMSYWYVIRDPSSGTTPDLNPMYLEAMGFAWHVTGEAPFLTNGLAALAYDGDPTYWGATIKQVNQVMHSSGRGLRLLQAPRGSVDLVRPDCPLASDTTPPAVTPPSPASVIVGQSVCSGGNRYASLATLLPHWPAEEAALSAFVSGGTATDSCSAPVRLAAQLAGADITSATLFPVGSSPITFRFRDAAGNVGTAAGTVVVRRQGDLDVDGDVDVADVIVLAGHVVGNVPAGTPPFTAAARAADADGNGTLDVFDVVLLAGHIVGNVSCLTP